MTLTRHARVVFVFRRRIHAPACTHHHHQLFLRAFLSLFGITLFVTTQSPTPRFPTIALSFYSAHFVQSSFVRCSTSYPQHALLAQYTAFAFGLFFRRLFLSVSCDQIIKFRRLFGRVPQETAARANASNWLYRRQLFVSVAASSRHIYFFLVTS